MADYQRSAMLASMRNARAASTSPAPAAATSQGGGAQPTSEIEHQLAQMRLQNLQLQEHLLMQQAQAQAHAQQYAYHQQRWLQQQVAQAQQMMGGRYTDQQILALLAAQQGQGQQGPTPTDQAWEENQAAERERALMIEALQRLSHEEQQQLAAMSENQQDAVLRALAQQLANEHRQQQLQLQHARQRAPSAGSNSSSTAKLSSSPPPTLVLSRPDEAFPVFATTTADDTPSKKQQAPEARRRHHASGSLSSTSSSEGDDSSDFDSATTAGTNVSAFDSDKQQQQRGSHAAGLTAALAGRQGGVSPTLRPGSGQGSLNPFAASFAPSAPGMSAPMFAPAPQQQQGGGGPIVPQASTPFRVQSSPNNAAGGVTVLTAIPVRTPKGPCNEADMPSKNFASMARKRNLTLLGRRNPSSPTAASGGFAAAQEAGLAQGRKTTPSLQVPGLDA